MKSRDNIVILGCNGGTDIAYGGGAYVTTAMAKCLSENGFNVHLISTIGLNVDELSRVHGWSLNNNVYSHYIFKYGKDTRIPYIIALQLVSRFKKLINELDPVLVIYNDDYPLSIDQELSRLKVPRILYAHFPYTTRHVLGLDFMYKTTEWSLVETVINYVGVNRVLGDLRRIDYIMTNSEGTKNIISMVHDIKNATILRPPITSAMHQNIHKVRPVFLHAARQDKTFLHGDFTNFVRIISKELPSSFFIINRNKYVDVSRLGVSNKVVVTRWLSNDLWRRVLSMTKYYLHFKWFEGFGIATAEAIMMGAIPIVYRSLFNGSWTDIARLCDRDCGFSSVDEAVEHIKDLESDETKFNSIHEHLVNEISRVTNYEYFCRSLISIINKFV